jgi:hypothetical protein
MISSKNYEFCLLMSNPILGKHSTIIYNVKSRFLSVSDLNMYDGINITRRSHSDVRFLLVISLARIRFLILRRPQSTRISINLI